MTTATLQSVLCKALDMPRAWRAARQARRLQRRSGLATTQRSRVAEGSRFPRNLHFTSLHFTSALLRGLWGPAHPAANWGAGYAGGLWGCQRPFFSSVGARSFFLGRLLRGRRFGVRCLARTQSHAPARTYEASVSCGYGHDCAPQNITLEFGGGRPCGRRHPPLVPPQR